MLTEIVLQQLPTCYVARNFFSLGKNNEGDVNPHQFFIRRKSFFFFPAAVDGSVRPARCQSSSAITCCRAWNNCTPNYPRLPPSWLCRSQRSNLREPPASHPLTSSHRDLSRPLPASPLIGSFRVNGRNCVDWISGSPRHNVISQLIIVRGPAPFGLCHRRR